MFNYVFMSPFMYFLLSNVYIVPIITSAIAKDVFTDHHWYIVGNSFYFGIYPLSNFGPSKWISGYSWLWLLSFMLVQSIYAFTVYGQRKYGSRWFLPARLRSREYDQFKRKLDADRLSKNENCHL